MNRHKRRAQKAQSDDPTARREIVALKAITLAEMQFAADGSFQMTIAGPGQDDAPLVLVLRDDQVEGIVHGYQTAIAQYKTRMTATGQGAQANN